MRALSVLVVGFLVAGVVASTHPLTTGDLLRATSGASQISETAQSSAPGAAKADVLGSYQGLPLSFVPNAGQTDEHVRYSASGAGYDFFFTENKAVLALAKPSGGFALDLRFLGASPQARLDAVGRRQGRVNYLSGSDPSGWHTGLPTYGTLVYRGLWPGIDMRFQGAQGRLKYAFIVHPGASPSDIQLAYAGADGLSVGAAGGLAIHGAFGTLRDARPVSYQRIGGRKVPVASRYALGGGRRYGFAVGSYASRFPLVIDPSLDYSTFIGGSPNEEAFGIDVEGGRAYVTGSTQSTNYPTTPGAFDTSQAGDEVFVTKLNNSGSALVYSTFLGGGTSDVGEDVFVDNGFAYVTGETDSTDFPTTGGAFDTTSNGMDDAFVTKLNRDGSALVYSTYLGGTLVDQGRGIEVSRDRAYVTGVTFSPDFPTTTGAFQTLPGGLDDAFVTKLNPAGSAPQYSTYLGGLLSDVGRDIAVQHDEAYVSGLTESLNFPTTTGALRETPNLSRDAFATKLNSAGSGLVYSTYLGGTMLDEGFGIAVDGNGEAYLTGVTQSTDFPVTAGAYDDSANGSDDAFVTKLNRDGSALVYSTYLGGGNSDVAEEIDIQGGEAAVAGQTNSQNFPVTANAFDQTYNGGVRDAFVTRVDRNGSALPYSSYLGGGARDQARDITASGRSTFVTGFTTSTDFPTTPGAYDTSQNGNRDVFVTKL